MGLFGTSGLGLTSPLIFCRNFETFWKENKKPIVRVIFPIRGCAKFPEIVASPRDGGWKLELWSPQQSKEWVRQLSVLREKLFLIFNWLGSNNLLLWTHCKSNNADDRLQKSSLRNAVHPHQVVVMNVINREQTYMVHPSAESQGFNAHFVCSWNWYWVYTLAVLVIILGISCYKNFKELLHPNIAVTFISDSSFVSNDESSFVSNDDSSLETNDESLKLICSIGPEIAIALETSQVLSVQRQRQGRQGAGPRAHLEPGRADQEEGDQGEDDGGDEESGGSPLQASLLLSL